MSVSYHITAQLEQDPTLGALDLDQQCGYQRADRNASFDFLEAKVPELLPFMNVLYGGPGEVPGAEAQKSENGDR